MKKIKYIYYQEDEIYVGWLEEYPDYKTQGSSIEELQENLLDIYQDITRGHIPYVHHVAELLVA